ncbi:MAG: diadenylate cyclase CdaA [Prevotellaceae bacterium]|jgi:uncharacterized protein (TIGR00159 family)|nr:diadenylate cyclase CdaA [Prevotellaceae bacterium]
MDFINFSFIEIIDILMVAFIFYQIYKLIKGTAALNIFVAVILVYVIYLIVKLLKMELMTMILGQFIGVGVIALIILFQQEIRKFLLRIGTNYVTRSRSSFIGKIFSQANNEASNASNSTIVEACRSMSESKTGALIIMGRASSLQMYVETGDIIDAKINARLLENIFFKNAPLHDGAVIIINNKIHSARCILPSSENFELPAHFGMRHRAAVGITEVTDAVSIVVSEETGRISYVENGKIENNISPEYLLTLLEKNVNSDRK